MVELVPAVCPRCGANLQLPENLEKAHCIYCGTEIIIEIKKPDIHYHGVGSIENYFKMADVALTAKNYQSAVEYCSKVLELDTSNKEAWLKKAIALSNLAKYDEAIACCDTAMTLSPDEKTIQIRKEIVSKYIDWIIEKVDDLGKEEWEEATLVGDPADVFLQSGTIARSRLKVMREKNNKILFEYIDRGLALDKSKKSAQLYLLKGKRLGSVGRTFLAKEYYKKAKEIDPNIKTGPCFIATATYGTPMAQEVNALKQWRDTTLMRTTSGRAVVKIYYTISPPIADFISTSERLRYITRRFINPFVHFARTST